MRIASVTLRNVGVFEDTTIRFGDGEVSSAPEDGIPADSESLSPPRDVTVLFGADGIGKTTLLAALTTTRPGHALPPSTLARAAAAALTTTAAADEPSAVVTEWVLGHDDPERPHPLVVASPSALLRGETNDAAMARRREQALFDRRAQSGAGFVFVALSGARWFSRAANLLSVPDRSILRYDVRQAASFDDPTRADLTRETKQVLSYAAIARALADKRAEYIHLERFEAASREVMNVLLEPSGFRYGGVSPLSLEPEAISGNGTAVPFDALPRAARHLVAFGALPLRALFAAYPQAEDPRLSEGVVAIDDVEAQQEPAMLRLLVPLLRRALPGVQWLLTTSSAQLASACDARDVVALRRTGESGQARVEVGEGILH